MPEIKIRIDDLVLDGDNPRITHAEAQQQVFQKVVRDQKAKLVRLAESIVEHGLSPIERLMVLEVNQKPKRYVALEGNRRVTALKLLTNPAAMTGLVMPDGMQRSMERLAKIFDRSKVEPIDAYEVSSRDESRYWIELRHNGEDHGRGVVPWKPIVASRFRKKEPTIQAFDAVIEHGGFDEEAAENIREGFSLTTLRRLMDSKDVRAELGLTVENGQLHTVLPGSELIKSLKKIVLDIAAKNVDSRRFNKTEKMLEYVRGFGKADKPDFSKKVASRPVEGIQKTEFAKARARRGTSKKAASGERRNVVPKNCALNVTNNRIAEIYQELRTLKIDEARNAIAVLMRVFLELSVDHWLEKNKISLRFTPAGSGREQPKKLDKKLAEAVDVLVKVGVPEANFKAIIRSLSVRTSPMNIDLFHQYVHDRFATPSPSELTAAWDHAQPLFERVWA
ncbi:MAG: hypothetical protein ACREC9_12470 [Methylocella sp.]